MCLHKLTCAHRFLQVFDSLFLACVTVALLVVQPSELLQDLGMVRVLVKHSAVGGLGSVKLCATVSRGRKKKGGGGGRRGAGITYVFLLLVDMANLEVDVLLGQWARRIVYNVLEALQTLIEFLLLLVNDAEAEINFVGLFKVGGHAHDLRESFFGMVERAIAVVENADSIPQFGLLSVVSNGNLGEQGSERQTLGSRKWYNACW